MGALADMTRSLEQTISTTMVGVGDSICPSFRRHSGSLCYTAVNDLPSEPHGNVFTAGGGGDDAAVGPSDYDAS